MHVLCCAESLKGAGEKVKSGKKFGKKLVVYFHIETSNRVQELGVGNNICRSICTLRKCRFHTAKVLGIDLVVSRRTI